MKKFTLLLVMLLGVLGVKADVTPTSTATSISLLNPSSTDSEVTYTAVGPFTMTTTTGWTGISCDLATPVENPTQIVIKLDGTSKAKLKVVVNQDSWGDVVDETTKESNSFTIACAGSKTAKRVIIQNQESGDVVITEAYFVTANNPKIPIDLSKFTTDSGVTYSADYNTLETMTTWKGVSFSNYNDRANKVVVTLEEAAKIKIYVAYTDATSVNAYPEGTSAEVQLDLTKTVSSINIQAQEGTIKLKSISFEKTSAKKAFDLKDFAAYGSGSYDESTKVINTTADWAGVHKEGLSLSASGVTLEVEGNEGEKNVHLYVVYQDDTNVEVTCTTSSKKNFVALDQSKKIKELQFKLEEKGSATLKSLNFESVYLDEKSTISIATETTAHVLLFNRSFSAGWNTLCLPFATTGTALGADVYEFISATTSSVTFKKLPAKTETTAGTPYLVKFASAASNRIFEDVTITATTAGTVEKNGVSFIGSYAPVSFTTTGNFGVLSDGSIKEGYAGKSSIKGYRAYFTGLTAPTPARVLIIDDEATGINNTYTLNSDNDEVYTLTGTKVNGQPTKGIFIKNGKKFIVK